MTKLPLSAPLKLYLILLFLSAVSSLSFLGDASKIEAQTERQPDETSLLREGDRFHNYAADFGAFAKAANPDYDQAFLDFDLADIGFQTAERLSSAATLVGIYSDLRCREDRTPTKARIEIDLRNFSDAMNVDVDKLNRRIPEIKEPGVAADAIQMRDELRNASSTLDRIKLQ